MKNIFLLSALTIIFLVSSCAADQERVDKMAEEFCEALNKYDHIDSTNKTEAAKSVFKISIKKNEYGNVSGTQFNETMEKKCPAGYKRLMEMYSLAKK